jgi:Bacterial transcriptional activator domain
LSRHGSGYALDVPADAVDVRQFERLTLEGRAALRREDARAAATALRSALGLWPGLRLMTPWNKFHIQTLAASHSSFASMPDKLAEALSTD